MTSVFFSMSLNTIYGQQNAVPSSELGEAVALPAFARESRLGPRGLYMGLSC